MFLTLDNKSLDSKNIREKDLGIKITKRKELVIRK